jgi:hypothetical protein
MNFCNITYDNRGDVWILLEGLIFGDHIANRKLGFGGLDMQVTIIPSTWNGRPESIDKLGAGRLQLVKSRAPLAANQKTACDDDCPHLVKSIRKEEYKEEKGCYVKMSSLIGKVRKVHKAPLKIVPALPAGSYKLRCTVWGDLSSVKDTANLLYIKALIERSSQHFAYSVNPPNMLKELVMKSESDPLKVIDSLQAGHSVYFGNKDPKKQDDLKALVKPLGFAVIQCLSLGDGSPWLPTCSTCKTPCDGSYVREKPKLILASLPEKSTRIIQIRSKV